MDSFENFEEFQDWIVKDRIRVLHDRIGQSGRLLKKVKKTGVRKMLIESIEDYKRQLSRLEGTKK